MAENKSNTNEAELRKGPWSREEDNMLIEYVGRHGEENWNAVQRNSGLLRCGQSYRLRWLNHLKPGLKKGAISAEEERHIVEFHAMFGNNWAIIATKLPGRTDNEIKNFWNCRVRRLKRARLPLYPPEVLAIAKAYRQQIEQMCSLLVFAAANGFPVSAYWSLGSASEISATITTAPAGSVAPVSSHATSNMANDMVLDAENLSRNIKGKNIMVDQDDAGEGSSNTVKKNNAEATNENQSNEPSNFQYPPGSIIIEDNLEEMNDHDDLYNMIDFSTAPAEEDSGSDKEM